MKIKVGEKIPSTEFFHIDGGGSIKKVKSIELLAKQKAIVIGVPGAFTKVCSAQHLPGYVKKFEEAKKNFRIAARDKKKKIKTQANNWIKYTENEEIRVKNLALRRDFIQMNSNSS